MSEGLKGLLMDAHAKCCERSNVSSITLVQSYHGCGFTPQAIAAALLTFGDRHAPVHQVIRLLQTDNFEEIVIGNLKAGNKIPGWGSDFIKGEPDPIFAELDRFMEANATDIHRRIHEISQVIWDEKEQDLHPNAAAYTAAVGLKLGYSSLDIHFLLIECRLPIWRKHLQDYERGSFNFPAAQQTAEGEK